ncbi:hypothetical protein [Nocardioides okcheonensis]|uniref:hypothetical protein n=1 Tax=Nocardioides okcheonensis TaxID=2894081 RepID=UPI001E61CCD9|nr:hypothetical protein [Nocardioides okcheonensis]UFN44685.1 hypothetical protein LN652_00205 [Nocardioides okcheonensis]
MNLRRLVAAGRPDGASLDVADRQREVAWLWPDDPFVRVEVVRRSSAPRGRRPW